MTLASRLSGDKVWLEGFIDEEETAVETWRRQRARILRGFHAAGGEGFDADWPEGPGDSLKENRERKANDWRRREAWARHWWTRYWDAATDEEAYAVWTLLLEVIDRRAHTWLQIPDGMPARHPNRVAHYRLNHVDLMSAMSQAEKKLDGEFLGRSTFNGVRPWLKRPD